MSDGGLIQGELQAQIMAAMWRLDAGTVEQVRSELPPRYRGAYNTSQTVLNRLAERGLLTRRKLGEQAATAMRFAVAAPSVAALSGRPGGGAAAAGTPS